MPTELAYERGRMKASSCLTPSCKKQGPAEGFSDQSWWTSGEKISDDFLAIIWYELPAGEDAEPAEVSFLPYTTYEDAVRLYTPTKWQFVGSNDHSCSANGDWEVLCENLSGQVVFHKRYCLIGGEDGAHQFSTISRFRCLGIKILATHGGIFTALRGIRILINPDANVG